ncbi:hypothetical protein [Deinococcus altitudinis]|uniref:hypothetical protein n=1 Tax=Deinococcus altitudinis TaxID=468914 RepID=UPI0038920C0D
MTRPTFPDRQACRAATLFIARTLTNPTPTRVSAALYLAESGHLELYGRLMFGGVYHALPEGPMCEEVAAFLSAHDSQGPGKSDPAELDISVIRALNATLHVCRILPEPALIATVQDVPWATALSEGGPITAERIAVTLPNAAEVLAYLADPDPDKPEF